MFVYIILDCGEVIVYVLFLSIMVDDVIVLVGKGVDFY